MAFPGSRASLTSAASRLVITSQLSPPDLPRGHAYMLKPGHPTPGRANLLRPHIALHIGTGILTCFPSATHLCLALGADSPYADERCVGNLALSARGLFTPFNATHVSIRTSDTSRSPRGSPFTGLRNAPLPRVLRRTRSFGIQFEPRYIFRAGRLDQ